MTPEQKQDCIVEIVNSFKEKELIIFTVLSLFQATPDRIAHLLGFTNEADYDEVYNQETNKETN